VLSKDIRFSLQINGKAASPARIYLGDRRTRPSSDPFVMQRRR